MSWLIKAILAVIAYFAGKKAGQQQQAQADQQATATIVKQEQDAADTADDAQTAAGKDQF